MTGVMRRVCQGGGKSDFLGDTKHKEPIQMPFDGAFRTGMPLYGAANTHFPPPFSQALRVWAYNLS